MEPGLIGRKYQHEGTDDDVEGREVEIIDKLHCQHLASVLIISPPAPRRGLRSAMHSALEPGLLSFEEPEPRPPVPRRTGFLFPRPGVHVECRK